MWNLRVTWLALVLAGLLASCESDTKVERTVPANGQKNVDPNTIIAIRLDDKMTSADDHNTDARNIVVTGDQTEDVYDGSIQKAHHDDIFKGQTVEEFQQGVTTREDPAQLPENPEEGDSDDKGEDTLVFLLQGGSFKPGENIRVVISGDITTRGVPLGHDKVITFQVAGGDSIAEGDFFVTTTFPSQQDSSATLRPEVIAQFSLDANPQTFEDAITIRGSLTGVHEDTRNDSDASQSVTSGVTTRLAPGDSFLPGEWVAVTWDSSIRSVGATPSSLAPYLLTFQVRPGGVFDGWEEVTVDGGGAEDIVRLLAGDFRVNPDGGAAGDELHNAAEFVLVRTRSLDVFRRIQFPGGDLAWRGGDPIEVGDARVEDAVVVDTSGDGIPEVVAVLTTDDEHLIQQYKVTDSGDGPIGLEEKGDPVAFPAGTIGHVLSVDLNADGTPELIVSHDSAMFRPADELPGLPGGLTGESPEVSTGYVTIFELGMGTPDLSDLGNPDALLVVEYQRVGGIPRFERSLRLEAHDLDGDGRLDLVNETEEGIVLYRNQTTTDNPFSFRRVGFLTGRGGGPSQPRAWVALDADRDHDVDILTWDGSGGLYHENHQPPAASRANVSGEDLGPLGLLFDDLEPVPLDLGVRPGQDDTLLASNVDGDTGGAADLVVFSATGEIRLLTSKASAFPEFDAPIEFPGDGRFQAAALGDFDGDDGLDVVVASAASLRVLASRGVEQLVRPQQSMFRLREGESNDEDEEDLVRIVVEGDLRARFSGYSLALDYDESQLEYVRFEEPFWSRTTGTFARCPDADLQGCPGHASVGMSYQGDTKEGDPADGVELGTFLFRPREVDESTETEFLLSDFTSNGSNFTNSVTTVDGGEEAAQVAEEPLVVVILPPPPPPPALLTVECQVVEGTRTAEDYRVLVSWDSPRGEPFSKVDVTLRGKGRDAETTSTYRWEVGSALITDGTTGEVRVKVTAFHVDGEGNRDDPPDEATGRCTVVGVILEPEDLQCVFRENSTLVRWTLGHEADDFNVYRNATLLGSVDGDTPFFEDPSPLRGEGDIYWVVAVVDDVPGPRSECEVGLPSPCNVFPGVSRLEPRAAPSSPNLIRFGWENNATYSRLVAELEFVPLGGGDVENLFPDGRELAGTVTEFLYEGDRDRGGALPGTYSLTLRAFGPSCAGNVTRFDAVEVPLPELDDADFNCQREGLSDLVFSWRPLWRGYDSLELEVTHTVDGQEVSSETFDDLFVSDTSYRLPRVEPIGSYEAELIATFRGEEEDEDCDPVTFDPAVTTGEVETGIGLESFEIPILATNLLRPVIGLEFELSYPAAVTLDDFTGKPIGDGRSRITVSMADLFVDPDPDGDQQPRGETDLVRLRARVPKDRFDLARGPAEPLVLSDVKLRFEGSDVLRPVAALEGSLEFHERHLSLDVGEVVAGNDASVRIAARATFTAPPQNPDYRMNAFQIHLRFNPRELALLPIRLEDQEQTAVGQEGFFAFPNEQTIEAINDPDEPGAGEINVGWVGFNFSDLTAAFLEPVIDEEVFVFHFRSVVAEGSPAVFSSISFVADPGGNQPTAFFPERDVPGVAPLEAFFDGGVDILPSGEVLSVAALEPNRGPLLGGNTVTMLGLGFPADAQALEVRLHPADGGAPVAVDPALVAVESSRVVRFAVPDSGRRDRSGAFLYSLELVTATGRATLADAYRYEAPGLIASDISTLRPAGGDLVRLGGTGLAKPTLPGGGVGLSLAFDVDGFDVPITADILRVAEDGSEVVFRARAMPAPDPGQEYRLAILRATMPGFPSLIFPEAFRILPGEMREDLDVESVEPDSASHCGGSEITIRGRGFNTRVEVEFGGNPAKSVSVVSSEEIRAIVPFADNPGDVTLTVRREGLSVLTTFRYTEPPSFVRGDANDDGQVNISDPVVITNLVLGQPTQRPENLDAADVDDNGEVDFGDAIALFRFVVEGGAPPAMPFPVPGQDPDNLADGICQ